MFGRVIFAVILGVAAALLGSFSLLERLSAPASVVAAPAPATQVPAGFVAEGGPSEPPQRESFGYREALLEADQRGQYAGEALINGLPVHMLVDTGASDVFVSASTAHRLGLAPSGGRKRAIQTANGQSAATPALLRRVSLGGLYMNDVEALVLAPEAGEINCSGKAFSSA
jgi:aspartyl protease family protein